MNEPFADIHCHLLPGIDDGASHWNDTLAMARLAVDDGITTIVATPHQLGSWNENRGGEIRALVAECNKRLAAERIPLQVLAGGEVRIEPGLIDDLVTGELVTLGDHRRHVLLELPHELYFPIDGLMNDLAARRINVVLAHPERNQGLLRQPDLAVDLVEAGCLMQLTAGSLCGMMGSHVDDMAVWMITEGLVHMVATDAHSPRTRRPQMSRAYERICELVDVTTADDLCRRNPAMIAAGRMVATGRRAVPRRRRTSWWRGRKSA
ncbi:MAG: tyrosine-protein phosphatase [Pirellulales bacterium]